MKKGHLLNSEVSYVISKMGHTDTITIGDCGLPIPAQTQRIDLAVVKGLPEFIPVLNAVLSELFVEKVILAKEILTQNKELNNQFIEIIKNLESEQRNIIAIEYISHEEFKVVTSHSKAIIRTGEFKPYANVILVSGVTF